LVCKKCISPLKQSYQILYCWSQTYKKITELSNIDKRIIVTGYVKDPYDFMSRCALVVSPMQTGGGIQNKILEGMALGKVNVTTSLGASSIYQANHNEHLLVEDSPIKMAELINLIVENPEQFRRIGENGEKLASDLYTWENFGKILTNQIELSIAN